MEQSCRRQQETVTATRIWYQRQLLVFGHVQVKSVNDKPVRNLKELVAEVDGTADKFLRFDLEYNQVLRAAPCHMLPNTCFRPPLVL